MNNWTTQQKNGDMIVGISLQPAAADHNSLFVELKNKKGEPIVGANVAVSSLKQFLFSTDRNIAATYVAIGTYRLDTNMSAGNSEINISIKRLNQPSQNFRIEASIPDAVEAAPQGLRSVL